MVVSCLISIPGWLDVVLTAVNFCPTACAAWGDVFAYRSKVRLVDIEKALYSSSSEMASVRDSAPRLRNLDIPRPSSCPPVARAEPTPSPFLRGPRSETYSPSLDGGPRNDREIPFVVNVEGPIEQIEVRNHHHHGQSDEVGLIQPSTDIPLVNIPPNEQQGWFSARSLA